MSSKLTFVVVSGSLEYSDQYPFALERNFKYVSEPFETLSRALKEWRTNQDYTFNEIELWRDGKREGIVNPVCVDLKGSN